MRTPKFQTRIRAGVALTVCAMLAFAVTGAFADECAERLNGWTLARIEAALNAEFKADPQVKFRDHLALRMRGFGLLKPFRVTRRSDLLIDGQLPPLARLSEVVVIPKSRADGLLELRAATNLSEERSYYFVPAMDAWVYATVENATAATCGTNSLLGRHLTARFGRIEKVHTHPWAAFHYRMDEYGPSLRRGVEHLSDEAFALLILGVPSVDDVASMIWREDGDPRVTRPRMDHSIVHPWGVTSYSMHIVIDRPGEEHETALYAGGPGFRNEHLERASRQNSPESALRVLVDEVLKFCND
jgi:hypothetical protein